MAGLIFPNGGMGGDGICCLPTPPHHSLSLCQGERASETGLILLKIDMPSNNDAGEKISVACPSQATRLI